MCNKWNIRFLKMAKLIGSFSKDPSTKAGAVITTIDNKIISMGFNGFPKEIKDTNKRLNNRELKYKLIIHAEANALLFAKCNLSNCIIFITHPPCIRCTVKIIQSGIIKVVTVIPSKDFYIRWKDDLELSKKMYKEVGIVYIELNIKND